MCLRPQRAIRQTAGNEHADGNGRYVLVTATGKYWRLNYRHLVKRKTLALGVYPDVTVAKARERCVDTRWRIADGVDPAQAKRHDRQEQTFAATETFEPRAALPAFLLDLGQSAARLVRQRGSGKIDF